MSGLSLFATPIAALFSLAIAAYFAVPPTSRGKPIRIRVLARALLPNRIVRSRSGRLDIVAFLFSVFLVGTLLGWAFLSGTAISHGVVRLLNAELGARTVSGPAWLATMAITVAVFVAYEFGYWFDHWLCHRFAVLWEFHKVHHSAESLSVLTNYRVHPVDTILFYNIVAITTGVASGLVCYVFGRPVDPWVIGGADALTFLTTWLLTHLQHSHLWISFPGRLGNWIISPAHHQIHHSTDPAHHNRNFGSTLALWDRLFGTLCKPTAARQHLRFGVDDLGYDAHSITGALAMPFVDAARHIKPAQGSDPELAAQN